MTASPSFDPGLLEFLHRSASAPRDPSAPMSAQRASYTSFARTFDTPRPAGLTSSDIELQGPAGKINARLYRPRVGRLPVIMYFHGGGFIFGNPDSHDSFTADLAATSGAALVSVDYRLAPEHPFPAAFEDCLAATLSIVEQANRWDLDDSRIVLAGDSSGGNLAAAVAIALREARGPDVRGQVLIYPMLGLDFETPSCLKNPQAPMLSLTTARTLAGLYLPGGFENADWRAAPLRARDVSNLPQAYISVAEHDPLRDDGIQYAARLAEAGVPSVLSRGPGLVHSWIRARALSTAAYCEFRRISREISAMLS